MARIRTIKPEFPQSESIGKLSRDARLLYIQLWTIADDAGRARAASRMLASLLYPYDDDARKLIDRWLEELERGEHIRRYEVDGSQYLEIVKWLEHQKIDKPSKSRLPEFVEGSRNVAKSREGSSADLGPRTCTMDLDRSSSVAEATRPESRFDEFWKSYPKRKGDNPRKPAEAKFNALVKTGVDPQMLIDAIKRYAVEKADKIGTEYIPMAQTWLSQQRWTDHAAVAFNAVQPPDDGTIEVIDQRALDAWDAHAKACGKPSYPRNRRGGWRFPSKWPPGYEATMLADVEKILAETKLQ